MLKNLTANAGDARNRDLIPGLGRSPGEGHGSPLQYSCLENPMDRGTCQATVHGVTKSWMQWSTHRMKSILLGVLNHIFMDEEMKTPIKCLDYKLP